MIYNSGYHRNVLENAGMISLQRKAVDASLYREQPLEGTYGQSRQQQPQQQVSYARNFKMRLFNGDPDQERGKQAVKENYKQQLARQMVQDRKRKEQEKKRRDEQDRKYEAAFYQNLNKPPQQHQLQSNPQQNFSESFSPVSKIKDQKNKNQKSISEKQDGWIDKRSQFVNKDAQRQFEYIDGLLGSKDSTPQISMIPNLLQKRSLKDQQFQRQSPPFLYQEKSPFAKVLVLEIDPIYQQQRLASIQQFQESILRKVDDLRHQIGQTGVSTLETNHQIDRIRGLLRNREILAFDMLSSNISIKNDHRKPEQNTNDIRRMRVVRQQYVPSWNNRNLQDSSGQQRQLEAITEVRYPSKEREQTLPIAPNPSAFSRLPQMKSESSEAEDQQYDKVDIPDMPAKHYKPIHEPAMSKFAPFKTNQPKDASFEKARFIPKSDIIDYKIENMLSNIDNLIQHYDKD